MGNWKLHTEEEYELSDLCEIAELVLVGNHADRKLAPNIDNGGNVHLNVLEPGSCAGNHYHLKVQEFFINPGPGRLLLHMRHPRLSSVEIVEISPASLSEVKAYHVKLGIPHMVENPERHRATLVIVVDRDDPSDVYPASVYVSMNES
jgi:oxalate decarboxylase/phosphoglucose isomerase-like protein (cupin superfamily)